MKNKSAKLREAVTKWLSFKELVDKWATRARKNLYYSQTSEERMFYLNKAFCEYRIAVHYLNLSKAWKHVVDSLS